MNWYESEIQALKDFFRINDPFGGSHFTGGLRRYQNANSPPYRPYDISRRAENRGISSLDILRHMPLFYREPLITPSDRLMWGEMGSDSRAPNMRSIPTSRDYRITMDVEHYSVDDLAVKVIDRYVIVKGQHNQRVESQDCWASRQFIKKFKVPDNIDLDSIRCDISTDKYLTLTCPIKNPTSHRLVPMRVAVAGLTGTMLAPRAGSEPPRAANMDASNMAPQHAGDVIQVHVINANDAQVQPRAGSVIADVPLPPPPPVPVHAANADGAAGPLVPPAAHISNPAPVPM